MIIREALNKDRENICSIAKESEYISLSENILKNYMGNNVYKVVVAQNENNEIVGFLIFSFVSPEAEIIDIAVLNKYRMSGVGRHLINYLIDFVKENRGEKIILDVSSDNENAYRFYLHFGFKKDGIRKNYYVQQKNKDAVLMSFNL